MTVLEQQSFIPYTESKSPEERRQYIEEQVALGNPKYLPRNTWLKENSDKIRISKLEAQVNELLARFPK